MSELLLFILVIISGCLCLFFAGFCFVLCRISSVKTVSIEPGLGVYLKIMFPLTLILPSVTTIIAVYCLFGNDFNSKTTFYLRSIQGFAGLIVDTTALTLSINCAVASLTSDRSPLLHKTFHGYCAAVCSILYALGFIIGNLLLSFALTMTIAFLKTSLVFTCFLIELVLLAINIRHRKIVPSAYRLSVRHNLIRNVKMLQFICPFLFSVTLANACGLVAYFFGTYTVIITPADGAKICYIFYNFSFLSVILLFMITCYNEAKIARKPVADVELEKKRVTGDHFEQLKILWK